MRLISFAIAAAIAALSSAAAENTDTITTIHGADSLAVVRTDSGLKVVVDGRTGYPDYHYEYVTRFETDSTDNGGWNLDLPFLKEESKPRKKGRASFNIGFEAYAGTSIPTGSTPMLASWEIGLSRILSGNINIGGGLSFGIGLGFGYQQYAVGDGLCFTTDRQHLLFAERPEGIVAHSSRLRMWRMHIPVTFTQRLSRKTYVCAGAWLNWNLSCRASSSSTVGSVTTKHVFKDLHERTFNTDIFLSIGLKGVAGIYARYTPQSLFRKGWGPDFNSVSLGLITNF